MMEQTPHDAKVARNGTGRHLPTVDEALKYSPLTSIVPYDHESIPTPTVAPSTFPFTNRTGDERTSEQSELLRILDEDASQGAKTSQRLEQSLHHLQGLLSSAKLTHYEFHRSQNHSQHVHKTNGTSSSNGQLHGTPKSSQLGPFATMLLESADVPYYYTSGAPYASQPNVPFPVKKLPQQLNNGKRTLPHTQINDGQHLPTGVEEKSSKKPSEFLGMIPMIVPPPARPTPSVLIPSLPAAADLSQYQTYPEIDETILMENASPNRKRKREYDDDESPNKLSRAQREQGESIFKELQELIASIFEAEDKFEYDTSGLASSSSGEMFVPSISQGGQQFILAPSVLSRLNLAITNAISSQRFSDIHIDYLTRIQRLCFEVLDAINGLELNIPSSSDDVEAWTRRLEAVEGNMEATKILLRVMSSGREEKELYSEDILQRLLNNLKAVIESCVIPIVEVRATSAQGEHLSSAMPKQVLSGVLQKTGRVIKLLGNLILKVDLSESSTVLTEYLAVKLIFVENSISEKESIFGIQKFENFRRTSMDLLTRIFLRHPKQRGPIFDEILSSLEKLPVTRQNARHYKIVDGKPIQLVSALIMQLIHTSTVRQDSSGLKSSTLDADDSSDSQESSSEDSDDSSKSSRKIKHQSSNTVDKSRDRVAASSAIKKLMDVAKQLNDSAQQNATYVVHYLVQRALTSTKSGDQPYRNLLDIFTEDLAAVFGSADWPAAELLLRMLLTNLVGISEDLKSSAPAKNMALDLMGVIGSGIADLQSYINRTYPTLEKSDLEFSEELGRMAEDSVNGNLSEKDILSISGPCRAVVEHLHRCASNDIQAQNALQFYLVQWARKIWAAADDQAEDNENTAEANNGIEEVSTWLLSTMEDLTNLEEDTAFSDLPSTHLKMSYALSALSMPLGRASKRIFSILISGLSSHHATVRSRSLKSVDQLVDKDPSILDRAGNIVMHILRSASDQSAMVRDSALNLVGKCIALRPALENKVVGAIISKCSDSATSVRKRVMKLLKEIYARNKDKDTKVAIAEAFLQATDDVEDSVGEIAKQTLEEVWLIKYHQSAETIDTSIQAKGEIAAVVALVITISQQDRSILTPLEAFFQEKLGVDSKNSSSNRKVVKSWMKLMFDGVIENDSSESLGNQQSILHTLTVFAKARPRLFNTEQMVLLRPYIENLSSSEDLLVYRSVIMIYRRVLPILPSLQHDFLKNVQHVLFSSVSRLGKLELREVAECLSIIDSVLQNTERLVRLMISVLSALNKGNEPAAKVKRYILIAGSFGKACYLEDHIATFKEKLSWWKGDSVSSLVVEVLCSYADSGQPEDVRENALESICQVCHSSPKNFLPLHVNRAFEYVFAEGNAKLQYVVLSGINDFYAIEEERSKTTGDLSVGEGTTAGLKRLSKSMTSDNDGATTSIAQHFLSHIIRLALASQDDLALVATEIIVSTNRQGLVHPRECAPTLVALETSSSMAISKRAFEEHRNLHHKHESMLEKEYLKAIEQAYQYQQTIIGNTSVSGVNMDGTPKLHLFYEVLKTGSPALRKKLFANICTRLDFHVNKLQLNTDMANHLQYSKFVLENIGLFDYIRVDEILQICTTIEKIFSNTGNIISQHIERHLGQTIDFSKVQPHPDPNSDSATTQFDVRQLTMASVILSMLWETRTYLRQTWSLQSYSSSKKLAAKDANKAPMKSANANPEGFLGKLTEIMASLVHDEAMMERCQAFIDLLAVDNEHRAQGDDEDEANSTRLSTPSEEGKDRNVTPILPSGGSKTSIRRGSASVTPTPQKPKMKKRPSTPGRRKSSSARIDDEEERWH